MKILLHDDTPAYLCPGGKQVHAQKLYKNLRALDVSIEYDRWWDPSQKCDLIHLLSCSPEIVFRAHEAGLKVILTDNVDATNYPWISRTYRRLRNKAIRSFHSKKLAYLFPWYILPSIDASVYMHKFDLEAAVSIYGVPRERTYIIPHGCDQDVIERLRQGAKKEQSYLVCMATITPVKNNVLLAKAAKIARVPVVFLGKPYNENDPYNIEFRKLLDNKSVINPGYVSGEVKERWLKEASGFVLLSEHESGCIAIYEAAAAGLPLLLPDLPWAYTYGKNPNIRYIDIRQKESLIADKLRTFFMNSKRLDDQTFTVLTWKEIARQYVDVYQRVLSRVSSPPPL